MCFNKQSYQYINSSAAHQSNAMNILHGIEAHTAIGEGEDQRIVGERRETRYRPKTATIKIVP